MDSYNCYVTKLTLHERMDGLNYRDKLHAQADHPKEANAVKKLIADHYSSLQIKRHITLKNERLQVVF